MKMKTVVWISVLSALVMLSACSPRPNAPPTSGSTINVVEALGLGESVRVEIMEFDLENVDPNSDYLPVTNITNLEKVDELLFLLDGELEETPALMCIPEYRLRFWLEDGSQVDLGLSCGDALFLTGDQSVFEGRQYAPPGKFTGLIESYVEQSVEIPERINLLKAAEFTDVVRVEIMEQNLGEGSAEINSVMVIEDIEVLEEIVMSLSGDYRLAPRLRCPVNYFLTFTMEDDRAVTFGYMCTGEEGILRGDQDYFFGQDIQLGNEFPDLFARLIEP
jgi:hypothetical protein